MTSRGRERRGCPRGASQAPPVFDQHVVMEAMSVAFASFSHTSAVGGQGGPSNLQRFKSHHPLIFTGRGNPMVVDHWFRQIEKILEAIKITSDATKTKLTAFQLEGESQVWWD